MPVAEEVLRRSGGTVFRPRRDRKALVHFVRTKCRYRFVTRNAIGVREIEGWLLTSAMWGDGRQDNERLWSDLEKSGSGRTRERGKLGEECEGVSEK